VNLISRWSDKCQSSLNIFAFTTGSGIRKEISEFPNV
jgi:hypothetical protein